MKSILYVLMITLVSVTLYACQSVKPLENPEPELFSLFYEGSNFTILKRTDINEDIIYPSIAVIIFDDNNEMYAIGAYHINNYLVYYKDKYYDLQAGNLLHLYTADDLIEIGINAQKYR